MNVMDVIAAAAQLKHDGRIATNLAEVGVANFRWYAGPIVKSHAIVAIYKIHVIDDDPIIAVARNSAAFDAADNIAQVFDSQIIVASDIAAKRNVSSVDDGDPTALGLIAFRIVIKYGFT